MPGKIKISLVLIVLTFNILQTARAAAPMDFDGDGKTDLVVLNSENLGNQTFRYNWYVLRSRDGYFSVQWGAGRLAQPDAFTDHFVPADYDGDGKTDFAVWRRPLEQVTSANGLQCYFYILYSATGTYAAIPWGRSINLSYSDTPVPQDYDGDGKADIAIFRYGGISTWWILQSGDGNVRVERFGSGDEPVRGDYDGDGRADLAVARTSDFTSNATYNFFIKRSSDSTVISATLGRVIADFFAPGDYDGDGKTDIALFSGKSFEFSTGYWKWIRSRDGQVVNFKWGYPTDLAAQGDYDGDGKTDVAIYRKNSLSQCNVPSHFWINGSRSGVRVVHFGSCHNPVGY